MIAEFGIWLCSVVFCIFGVLLCRFGSRVEGVFGLKPVGGSKVSVF